MTAKPFHLAWFTNFTPDEWNGPFSNGGLPWDGKFYVEMAQALERACFDYIMFEDKLAISEAYGGTMEVYLKHALGMAPDTGRLIACPFIPGRLPDDTMAMVVSVSQPEGTLLPELVQWLPSSALGDPIGTVGTAALGEAASIVMALIS